MTKNKIPVHYTWRGSCGWTAFWKDLPLLKSESPDPGARVLSGLHPPPHMPRWPPLLCALRQCWTMSETSVSLPTRQTPGMGQPALDHLICRSVCVCVHVRVRMCVGVRIWQTRPLPALLSLLYLINVIYSWSSVSVRERPSPEPAMVTA